MEKIPTSRQGGTLLKSQSTADVIASSLRVDISLGKLIPGAALRQEDLAERFAVSRIPVREALRRLESDGLVEVFPNRGAFVVRLTITELTEITDLRVLIEGDLILRSVPLLTPSDLSVIRTASSAARRESMSPTWVAADLAFHEALYSPSKRVRQLSLFRSLRLAIQRYEAVYRRLPEQRRRWLEDHDSIVRACSEGDARDAHRKLVDHIQSAGAFLIQCVERSTAKAR